MAINISPSYSLTPSSTKSVLASNYIVDFDYTTQFLPEIDSKEFSRYGNRSVSGMLNKLSAELPYSSDLVKWSEEGRLHTAYTDVAKGSGTNVFTKSGHVFRVNETIIVTDGATANKALITATDATTFTAIPYSDSWDAMEATNLTGLKVFVYGSEFKKGTNGMSGSLDADTQIFKNKGIIVKDLFEVSGSDMTQIGWIEVTDNSSGQKGYLWYLKSKSDTVARFSDRLEMSCIEGEESAGSGALDTLGYSGTRGLFSSIETNGNIHDTLIDSLPEFDGVVDRLNKQGSIEENMIYNSTEQDRAIDDMLALQNAHFSAGANWGAFDNSEKMGLELGFQGFRRSGYSFYKTGWKYLDDATTRGLIPTATAVHGFICPVGSKSVKDEVMGGMVKQPFMHVRYRKSATEDRKYKTWITGSAGGATSSDLDAMQVNFLSERMLNVIGVNNFVIIKG